MIGAASYIVFSSIQLGFEKFMIEELINRDGHIRITPRDEFITADTVKGIFFQSEELVWKNKPYGRKTYTKLVSAAAWLRMAKEDPDVLSYAPMISASIIISNSGYDQTITLIGIDPVKQMETTSIRQDITSGNLENLNSGLSGIFLGDRLMKFLGVRLNDTIQVSTAGGSIVPMKVIGSFDTGDRRFGERTAYASLVSVQNILNTPGQISRIVIKLADIDKAASKAIEWQKGSRDLVESWDQANADRLKMMSTQSLVRNITTITLIIVIAFGIYNILNMVVNQKKREIAILRSMGYNQFDTTMLFLTQGVVIGITGAFSGLILGAAIALYVETIKIPVGRIGFMRIDWSLLTYIKAFFLIFLSSAIASYFPARLAGRMAPIDIIRDTI